MAKTMPARLSTLTVSTPGRALPCHRATTGTVAADEVVEQPRLVAHVAEQDDGVAMPGLEHGVQLDRLVGEPVGAAEHDVVVALPGPRRHGLDGRGEERVGDLPDDDPEQHRLGAAQAAGQRVGPVAEAVGDVEHALAGVGGDRHDRDGVVEDARHGRLRDAGGAGDVLHRHRAIGSLARARRHVDATRHTVDSIAMAA